MRKCKIYFADLNYVRSGKEWTIIPFPLNVAYIAAFVQKMRPEAFDIKIFKSPEKLLDAISREAPDIVAFSNYIWNKNLQLGFARHIKELHPQCITVMGGPNYNFGERAWIEKFAGDNRQIDFHIDGEGEVKFYNLAACVVEHGMDLDAVRRANPAGVTYLDPTTRQLIANTLSSTSAWACLDGLRLDMKADRLLDLNDIPSPYLTGLLDEFLADPNYCPIIETNRGCPYLCTFCNWGDMGKSKSAMFSHSRVEEELRHIARHNVSKTPYLYIGDANFGMFERDVEFAKLLRELKDTLGFPQNVYLYFAKNSSEKVIRIAEILKDMTRISLSRQTQNPEVLQIIKRSNITMDTFSRLANLAKSLGVESFVELIYALPGESKESFFAGVKKIMDQRVDGLHMFPAMLLDGSEMGTQASRDQYGIKGEWRKIDGSAGRYGPIIAMEFEEIITETNAMSREDYFEIRLFHFFQTLFLDTKLYKDIEVLIGDWSLFDLIRDVMSSYSSAPAPFKLLIDQFIARAKAEMMSSLPEEIIVDEVESSRSGLVKLNPLFICKLLFDPGVRDSFHAFLRQRILEIGSATEADIDNVIHCLDQSIYPFDGSASKRVSMAIDPGALSGRLFSREARVSDYTLSARRIYRFTKKFTYQSFLEQMSPEQPLAEKIYEVILHHAHEPLRKAISWSLEGEDVDCVGVQSQPQDASYGKEEKRQIQTEGGWLY